MPASTPPRCDRSRGWKNDGFWGDVFGIPFDLRGQLPACNVAPGWLFRARLRILRCFRVERLMQEVRPSAFHADWLGLLGCVPFPLTTERELKDLQGLVDQ